MVQMYPCRRPRDDDKLYKQEKGVRCLRAELFKSNDGCYVLVSEWYCASALTEHFGKVNMALR